MACPPPGETEAPLLILGIGLFACGGLAAALARWRSRESALRSASASSYCRRFRLRRFGALATGRVGILAVIGARVAVGACVVEELGRVTLDVALGLLLERPAPGLRPRDRLAGIPRPGRPPGTLAMKIRPSHTDHSIRASSENAWASRISEAPRAIPKVPKKRVRSPVRIAHSAV